MRILFSGGGTGGHIYPAIAIADAIKEKKPEAEILFVGAKDKLEMEKVPKAGYKIKGLWISGFHRGKILRNLTFPIKLLHSLWNAWRILRSYKPDVVVGVGGFASGPILEVASRMAIPCLIQEQNSFPGITNRLLAKKVNRICVAYEHMERYFPKEKLVLTGNPVRDQILDFRSLKVEDIQQFNIVRGKKTLFVFGGSLGARSLNEAVQVNFETLKQRQDVQLIWQVGKLYFNEYKNSQVAQLPNVSIHPFVERMDQAYALADLIISRAGALTISELCIVGKPAILIPSPNVAEDHQTMNAKALTKLGAAKLISDAKAADTMIKEAIELLENEDEMKRMASQIEKLAIRNADEIIADEIIKLTLKPE